MLHVKWHHNVIEQAASFYSDGVDVPIDRAKAREYVQMDVKEGDILAWYWYCLGMDEKCNGNF